VPALRSRSSRVKQGRTVTEDPKVLSSQSQEILLLKKKPFRDRSYLIEGLSRASGRLAGVIHHSRHSASLDAPVLVRLSSKSGGSLESFSQPVILKSYMGMRKSLQALLTAGFLGRLFLACLPEREPDEPVYDLLCELYDALNEGAEARVCGLWGQDKLLLSLGIAPHLSDCVLCQKPEVVGFSATEGGVLCHGCYKGNGLLVRRQDLVLCGLLRERSWADVSVSDLTSSGVRLAGLIYKAQFQAHLEIASDYFKRVLPPRQGERG
jgi:DNA repair protein RecO